MAEYNPSKIIKDGNTYNFRDTTKIPLAGSNQISGSLIPSTDNSIDIGSSTNNIKMLYTKGITIDGEQFLPSDYMTLNTVQTVTSEKNYSGYQNINGYRLRIKSLNQKKGVIPASNQWNGFYFTDKNDEIILSFDQCMFANGTVRVDFSSCANDNNTTFTTFLQYINNSDLTVNRVNVIDLMPFGNGTRKLGDTNAKWKSLNGINPGALSLPSGTYINVDTTDWDLTCQNTLLGSFTPTADGWLMLHIANSGTGEVNFWVIGGVIRINSKSTFNTFDNNNFNMITIPVEKDVTYNIYGNASEYVAGRSIRYCRFMPCRGNV